jgi:hypothetical protein
VQIGTKMTKKIKLVLTENQIDALQIAMDWAIGTVDSEFKQSDPEIWKEMQQIQKLRASVLNTIQNHYAKAVA